MLTYKHKKLLGFLRASNKLFKGKCVLDAGGRDGLIIDRLNDIKWKILLDLNKNDIKKSTTETKVIADITHLPFINKCFHLAIFSEVMEHMKDPEQGIRELERTCKHIVMTTPNNSIFRRILWKVRRKSHLSSEGHVKEYSPAEIKHTFQKAGFTLITFLGIGFIVKKPKFLNFFEQIPYLSSKVLMHFASI